MSAGALTRELVLGTWSLVEYVVIVDGEVTFHPLGEQPVGQIMYGADDRMSALLMRRDRRWRSDGDFLLDASTEERAAAALAFVGYGGSYELRGDRVIHHVEMSLYPEMVGTDLVRTATWRGDHLVLDTEHLTTPSGRTRWQRLTWRRA